MSDTSVARHLADGLATPQTVLARVWLTIPPNALRLAASAGFPTGGGSYSRLDGTFATIVGGEGKIGRIAATGTPLVVPQLRGDEDWLSNPSWVARQGIRSFAGYPLTHNDHLVGVLAVFDRARPSAEDVARHELLARLAAIRVIDLREREVLLERLREWETRPSREPDPPALSAPRPANLITRRDLRTLERETLEAALSRTGGRVFGPRGAALLLGMKPTTLTSRMRALGIPPALTIRHREKHRASSTDPTRE